MKKLVLLFALSSGCAGPDIERLTRQLGENNATFYLEVPTHRGSVKIGRALPNVGFSTAVTGDGGVSVIVPTNVTLNVQYLVPVTNGAPRAQPQPQPRKP